MTQRIPVVVLVLVLLGAVPATAQTPQQERLKGVDEVRVLIEDLTDGGATCGITETLLTTAASKAVLDNAIEVTDFEAAAAANRALLDSGDLDGLAELNFSPTLRVAVSTIHLGTLNWCVSHISIELYVEVTATPSYITQTVFGRFMLANAPGMDSSGDDVHAQRVRDTVFEYVEAIAVDIRIANQ